MEPVVREGGGQALPVQLPGVPFPLGLGGSHHFILGLAELGREFHRDDAQCLSDLIGHRLAVDRELCPLGGEFRMDFATAPEQVERKLVVLTLFLEAVDRDRELGRQAVRVDLQDGHRRGELAAIRLVLALRRLPIDGDIDLLREPADGGVRVDLALHCRAVELDRVFRLLRAHHCDWCDC